MYIYILKFTAKVLIDNSCAFHLPKSGIKKLFLSGVVKKLQDIGFQGCVWWCSLSLLVYRLTLSKKSDVRKTLLIYSDAGKTLFINFESNNNT